MAALEPQVAALVGKDASVAADVCSAPYLLERASLTLLCRLDVETLQSRGRERWEQPVPSAFSAQRLVVRTDCPNSGSCVARQLEIAQQKHAFRLLGTVGPFAVLGRDAVESEPAR